jgi:hypothetical protein
MSFRSRQREYDNDLDRAVKQALGIGLVKKDLEKKRELMRADAFGFLRGSCWWWAETAKDLCSDILDAPETSCMIDSHCGNFGLWLDNDGRLVWGANDFDEAAVAPYTVDLVRLTASIPLAQSQAAFSAKDAASIVLDAYAKQLAAPAPIVLEQHYLWLRVLTETKPRQLADKWTELLAGPEANAPDAVASELHSSMPPGSTRLSVRARHAGVGGRGLPRFVLSGTWQGGPAAREAKAKSPSSWTRVFGLKTQLDYMAIAAGPFRAVDPWLRCANGLIVRRLSPNSRKVELGKLKPRPCRQWLAAAASELANLHSGRGVTPDIAADLRKRGQRWLAYASEHVVQATHASWKEYRKIHH